jgi:type IV secretory pathway VirB10-like protein
MAPAAPPEPDPALAAIFDRIPADELQDVALVRLSELKRFMASTRYTRWPPAWRVGVDMEFEHMKLCSGQQTVPDQQAAAQQAAEAQAQQAQQAEAAKVEGQIALERVKQEAQLNGKQKELDFKIDRDPTGRAARIRTGGPPPAQLRG